MSVTAARPAVKPTRPFGAGLVEPESPPIPRHRLNVHGTPLAAELRGFLRAMFYPAPSVALVVEHVGTHATAAGCAPLSPADAATVEAIIARHAPAPAPVAPRDEPPPRRAAFRPSDDDARWWAAESARVASERDRPAGRRLDGARASAALTAAALGVIPLELAEGIMSRSLVGWS